MQQAKLKNVCFCRKKSDAVSRIFLALFTNAGIRICEIRRQVSISQPFSLSNSCRQYSAENPAPVCLGAGDVVKCCNPSRGTDPMALACFCVPAITVYGLALSVCLRRRGYTMPGFAVQFAGVIAMALLLAVDAILHLSWF